MARWLNLSKRVVHPPPPPTIQPPTQEYWPEQAIILEMMGDPHKLLSRHLDKDWALMVQHVLTGPLPHLNTFKGGQNFELVRHTLMADSKLARIVLEADVQLAGHMGCGDITRNIITHCYERLELEVSFDVEDFQLLASPDNGPDGFGIFSLSQQNPSNFDPTRGCGQFLNNIPCIPSDVSLDK